MALTRRQFVQTAGIGAGAALTSSVWGRGRENSVWSAFEPTSQAVEQGVICIAQQREPGRARARRCSTRCARCSKAAPSRAATRTRSGELTEAIAAQFKVKPENVAAQRGLDRDPPRRDACVHGEDQAARRHHSDLRGMRRLRRADRQPGARRQARLRVQDRSRPDARRRRRAPGLVFYCNPNNPTATYVGAKATRDFLAKLHSASPDTTILVDEAYFDYVTDPDHDTHIPLAIENPRVIVARTFSKAYGMAGLRQGYAIGHPDTIKKMRQWVGVERHRLAQRVRHGGRRPPRSQQDADASSPNERARNKAVRDFTTKWFADRGMKPTDCAGQLHVRQHRHAGEGVPRRLPRQGRHGRARLPAVREDARRASRSARWKR